MGTGYTRNDTGNNIADGNVINASDLDGEFDAIQSAFNGSTGHSHDGTTGEGPQIDTAGIANDAVDSDKLDETDSYTVAGLSVTGNTTLGDAATDTVTFTADVASNILPNADGTLSLGASGSSWGDAYVTTIYLGGTEVTSNATELNLLDGVTATTAELNILDGVTSTAAELNLVDGSTAGTVVNSKAVIYGASGEVNATTLQVGGSSITATPTELNTLDGITSTTAELNILDGVTSTASELNLVDGSVAGTVTNSKAVIYGAAGEVNATKLQVGGTDITATPAEINTLDGITATTAELNILDGVTATAAELNALDGITATVTELNYTDGVTSNIQTQLTTLDTNKADVAGDTFTGDVFVGTNKLGNDAGDYLVFTTDTQLDVYINASNEFRFESDGDFHADGDVIAFSTTTASDERLKENIEVVSDAVEKCKALRGVTFDWKRDGQSSAGVIAQEVQQVLPEAVKQVVGMNGEEHLTVNYGALTSILIEAIKELTARVEALEAK